ncbi:MAG TPA: glycoside hydrolase family 3 C-terminal domain-containing protein [Cyclobacteriaceae bacterium]|nr:glycoside hydrolase family 3 C-terminal domain-containing protein [Cyclobacteriaceae bacterium]
MTRIVALLLILLISCSKPSDPKFKDTTLSFETRVSDLVSQMTLEEKISQMMNASPAIDRLGIPQYNWWSEGLHGVARAGLATVFPQAIGLGATWDEPMMFDVATAISDEARAKHHDFVKHDKRFLYQGLTLWSPNINIFRDPRWGRGQETYGEDPYLTGRLAVQFVKGLQGDDPKYFKTVATVKHFAVHSGPEPERHLFDAIADERDFRETYLPQFEMGVKEGKAYSVMCAYNRVNGEVCCGSNQLLTKILREEWGFEGYIVSDCGAITDIYQYHKVTATPEEAAAVAVKSGCDLECGNVYESLKKAVADKLITEEQIDVAVKRLFLARFKLGMFDPDDQVKYAQIPYSTVDSKEHRDLALEAARKSIVLLKNDKNTLPLKKDIGTLAVIGPNADQWLMLLGNYNGVPADPITPLRGIREKVSANTKVLFAQGSALADGMPLFETVPADVLSGLKAEYFNDAVIEGKTALYSEDVKILDANWKNKSPREDMNDDNFGVRWTGEITPKESGMYQVGVISTCNTKLIWADTVIAKTVYHFRDEYGDPRLRKSVPIRLEAGKSYKFKVEAGETYADAQVQLVWDHLGEEEKAKLKKEAIETAKKADAVVMFMGLTARLEGEEMDVEVEGFRGGDRTSIDLPKPQQDLIKEIHALGKPIVLVLLNGSALAINWESKNIPAIVEAWYPGQAAGTAIADVLFGDHNPGGKLPVTFYKSASDLPPFEDYHMKGHTYRYFKGTPLYPFGYGLSYTTFDYSDVKVDGLNVSVVVKNTGKVDGDEVLQVYVEGNGPIRSLAGFKRINLKAGESKTLQLELRRDAFATFDERGVKNINAGTYKLSIGGGQPGTGKTLSASITL